MSWYDRQYNAVNMGHSHLGHTGNSGTYYDLRNEEGAKAVADYRAKHLNAWLQQLYAMEGGNERD